MKREANHQLFRFARVPTGLVQFYITLYGIDRHPNMKVIVRCVIKKKGKSNI